MTPIRWLKTVWTILTASPRLEATRDESQSVDFVPDSTLIAYLENNPEPIAADSSSLPSLSALVRSAADAHLLVPLVSQGRLVGLLSLGTPRGSAAYSSDQVMFVATLADEAAAAATIAQLRSGRAALLSRARDARTPD